MAELATAPPLDGAGASASQVSGPPSPSRRPAYHEIIDRIKALETAPAFYGLPDRTLRALARRLRRVGLAAGDVAVHQGEPGDTIFFIRQGRCRLILEAPPNAVTVAILTEGDFFGEAACVLNARQPVSVQAVTDCTLLGLDRTSLYAAIGSDRALIDALTRVADERSAGFSQAAVHAGWGFLANAATVVAMYAPRGGSGATSLAVNLVGCLARRYPGQVLLLDLDLPYAHSALLAGLVPTSCLARMARVQPDAFDEVLLSAVLYHPSGPMILAGALKPEEADEITPELVARAITTLRKTFRYIVIDLSTTVSDTVLAVVEQAQHVVVITAPTLSASKSAADAITILQQLGVPEGRMIVVLNNRTPKPPITRAAVERLFKRKVDVVVGYDGERPDSAALKGEILSITSPASEIARGSETLADLVERHEPSIAPGRGAKP